MICKKEMLISKWIKKLILDAARVWKDICVSRAITTINKTSGKIMTTTVSHPRFDEHSSFRSVRYIGHYLVV